MNDGSPCPVVPHEQTFTMYGHSSKGVEVSTMTLDDNIIGIEFTTYRELGETFYYIIDSKINFWTTTYNMPSNLNGFDPKKSTKSPIKNYRIDKTETGDIVVSGDSAELSKEQARRLACLINAINNHVIGSEAVLPPLQLNCN